MNGIVNFRKCTMSDSELLKKVDILTDNMFRSLEVPVRHVPARPNEDYDLLVGELILRFKEMEVQFGWRDNVDMEVAAQEYAERQHASPDLTVLLRDVFIAGCRFAIKKLNSKSE